MQDFVESLTYIKKCCWLFYGLSTVSTRYSQSRKFQSGDSDVRSESLLDEDEGETQL